MGIIYRLIDSSYAKFAADLEKACLDTAWTKEQIESLPENAFYLGAFKENLLCGVLSAYFVADEVQIMNLAVAKDARRRGIAFGLLQELIAEATRRKAVIISLEVAEDNANALGLYEKCGFSAVGRRKGFYGDVGAIIMEKSL